jgi:hypothetical protein
MKKLLTGLLLFINLASFSQNWEMCYWESGFWMSCHEYVPDSAEKFIMYYHDGNKKHEGAFEYGLPSGTWTHWADNGTKMVETHYTGTYTRWDLDGNIVEKGQYVNGKKAGTWKQYAVVQDTLFLASEYNTELLMVKEFDISGNQVNEYEMQLYDYNRFTIYPGAFFIEVSYGTQAVDLQNFNEYIFINKKDSFGYIQDYLSIGIMHNPHNKICYSTNFSYYFPKTVDFTDTLSFKTSGYNIIANIGNDFVKSSRFDVILFFGAGLSQRTIKPNLKTTTTAYDSLFDFSATEQLKSLSFMLNGSLEGKINFILNQQGSKKTGLTFGGRVGYYFHVTDGMLKPNTFFRLNPAPKVFFDGLYLAVIGGLFF